MNKIKIFFIVSLLTLFSFEAFAQVNKLSEVLAKMEIADKDIETLEVDFNQNMIFTETKEKQSSQGYMAFMKPKSIFIERKTPQEQKIYISGKNMTIWTLKTGQAIVSDVPESINGDFSPVSFLNFGGNWKNLQKTNAINYVSEDDNEYVLSIYPKQNKTWEMTIHILKDGMNPNKIIVKSQNFSIDIDLSNYKINQTLNKKIFQIPQGIEIIKLN